MRSYLEFESDIKVLEEELDKLKDPYNNEGLAEVNTEKINQIQIDPKKIGIKLNNSDNLKGEDAEYNAEKIIDIFNGTKNEFSEAVSLNSAAGLIVAGKFNKFEEAYQFSNSHITSGKVMNHLKKIQEF